MMGITHRAGAIFGTMLAAEVLIAKNPDLKPIRDIVVLNCGGILGGYIADADTPHSHISRKFWYLLWPIHFIQALIRALGYIPGPLQKTIRKTGKVAGHRGIAHTPFLYITLSLLLIPTGMILNLPRNSYFDNTDALFQLTNITTFFALGCLIGAITHLLLDFISGGIMLLFPISTKRIKLASIKTGGLIDYCIFVALTIGNIHLITNWLGKYI